MHGASRLPIGERVSGWQGRAPLGEGPFRGIGIRVPSPEIYLEALHWTILRHYPDDPELTAVRAHIDEILGPRTAPPDLGSESPGLHRIVGWNSPHILGGLLDREWLVGESNELEPLVRVLDRQACLGRASRIRICGAGTCRLGRHLAELRHVDSVRCTDLSFLCLHLGKALIEGRRDSLPAGFLEERLHYRVDREDGRLVAEHRRADFHAVEPSTQGTARWTYEVADTFAPTEPMDGDLVLVPYVLDLFFGRGLVTGLIRLADRLKVGQELLLVVSLKQGRDPGLVVDTLRRCGLRILDLRLESLPYSLSRAGYTFVRKIYRTLVVEARKIADTDRRAILLRWQSGLRDELDGERLFSQAPFRWLRRRPFELTPTQWRTVRRAAEARSLHDLWRALDQELGEDLRERVLSHLLSHGGLHLRYGDPAGARVRSRSG